MSRAVKILIVAVAAVFTAYLLLSTLTSSQRYLSPSEILVGSYEGEAVAVMGRVAEPPIHEGSSLVFVIADDQARLSVRYQGPQVLLEEGGEVVVEGVYRGGEVLASKILTKCPSRYGSLGYVVGDMNTIVIPLAISVSTSIILVLAIIIVEKRKTHIKNR